MWHVDEGTMNAYLDGELGDRGAGSGERGAAERGAGSGERGAETVWEVETHLASCAECRALLERVKRVRDRAGEILASSSPDDVVAPPFEEIQARAEARSTGSRVLQLSRIKRLAWAATVVLAVAVGWYARGTVFPTRTEQVSAPLAASELEESAQSQEPGAGSGEQIAASGEPGADSREQGAGSGERGAEQAEEGAATVVAAELDRAVAPADRDVAGRGAAAQTQTPAEAPSTEVGAAAPPQAKAEPDAEVKLRQEVVDVSAQRRRSDAGDRLAAAAAPQAVVQQVAADEPGVPVGGIAVGEALMFEDSLWIAASEDEAQDALGGDVPVIPDLPVIDYWTAPLHGGEMVRVRQRLDEENVLELIVSRVVSDVRAAVALRGIAAEPAENEAQIAAKGSLEAVAIRRGDLRVVLRGPVSTDSLRVLGEKVR
ncbi:MAG: hypothetical protein JSW71_01295 [Gemmatimonadota bacterium]|nr:MAG: hypothetical protein JSW71_01295 [Gemmatimonadota bacterium]